MHFLVSEIIKAFRFGDFHSVMTQCNVNINLKRVPNFSVLDGGVLFFLRDCENDLLLH